MEGLSRYDVPDAYILEELKRDYQSSDVRGRIRLLKKLRFPPYEIARMAVEDPHAEVRQWIARNGEKLDYDESNLGERLKNDPDPFVRACLRENPHIFFGVLPPLSDWKSYFDEATHLERLALVRNRQIYLPLIEKIFDPDVQELGISMEEREQLGLAYLTNTEALSMNRRDLESYDGFTWHAADKHFTQLWKLASKWPSKSPIPYAVYRYVWADDKTKAETYKNCEEALLRGAILENSDGSDTQTMNLGMKDEFDVNRFVACGKAKHINPETVESLLQSKDTMALGGLANNRSLSIEQLKKVGKKLSELDDDGWADALRTRRELEESRVPEDPEALFGWEGREGDYTEDKIDFIGKRLLALEEKWEERLKKIENTTAALYEGAKSFVMVAWVAIIVLAAWWLLRALWRFVAGFL